MHKNTPSSFTLSNSILVNLKALQFYSDSKPMYSSFKMTLYKDFKVQ